MKFGLLVVISIVVCAFGASFLLADPGYIVIHFRGYLVEMSVPAMIGLIAILIFGLWLLAKLWRAPRKLGEAAGRYRSGRAGHEQYVQDVGSDDVSDRQLAVSFQAGGNDDDQLWQ